MKTQKQFIVDTLLPYKQNPKTCGYDNENCVYLTEDGRKCAVGKHMKKGEWQHYGACISNLTEDYDLEDVLTEEALAQDLDISVWAKMQGYHDNVARRNLDTANYCVRAIEKYLGIELSELLFDNLEIA